MTYSMYGSVEGSLYHPVVIEDKQGFWRRILIVDDDVDVTTTFKLAIEDSNNNSDVNKRIEVYTCNDPIVALSEFKLNFYDLLLVDINMSHMNGFELSEKILAIDITSGKINREAVREVYPSLCVLCQNWIRREDIDMNPANLHSSISVNI